MTDSVHLANAETKSVQAHTPGPWKLSDHMGGYGIGGGLAVDAVDPADGELFEICEVWGIDRDIAIDERARANARLIAAAPELMEALRGYIEKHEKANATLCRPYRDATDVQLEAARAAIAKATGAA